MHQRIHAAGLAAAGAHLRHQTARQFFGGGFFIGAHLRLHQHIGHRLGFIAAVGGGNGITQCGLAVGKIKHIHPLSSFIVQIGVAGKVLGTIRLLTSAYQHSADNLHFYLYPANEAV